MGDVVWPLLQSSALKGKGQGLADSETVGEKCLAGGGEPGCCRQQAGIADILLKMF